MNDQHRHTVLLIVTMAGFIAQINAKSTDSHDISSMLYDLSVNLKPDSLDLLRSIDRVLYYSELQKFAGPGVVFSASKPNTTHRPDDNIKFSRKSRSLLRDSCQESSDYELLTRGINEIFQTVALHENTWVYTSRCASVNSSCRGVIRLKSACKQKKGWAKAYARKITNGRPRGPYSWQWISVDRSCNCAISLN